LNDITELVDLPDPAVQPLVHPLDLPPARRPFRASWLIGALTSPPVAALAAVIIWFASHNYLVPLLAGAAIAGFGQLAAGAFREQAWAFIPRKRQDRRRPLPASWELGSGLALAAVLAAALLLATFRLDRPDVAVQVRAFTFGMGAAAGLLVVADFFAKLLRSRGRALRRVLFPLPGVMAVAGSLAVAYGVLFGSAGPDAPAALLWGAAAMLLEAAAVGAWKLARARRGSSRRTASGEGCRWVILTKRSV
jgi:hypothetical protein